MNKYKIGYTSCYINDHDFNHITDIPIESALEWVRISAPETQMGNGVKAKDLTINEYYQTDIDKNGWLNKLFVLVAYEHGKFVAIYNHDGVFSIRVK